MLRLTLLLTPEVYLVPGAPRNSRSDLDELKLDSSLDHVDITSMNTGPGDFFCFVT